MHISQMTIDIRLSEQVYCFAIDTNQVGSYCQGCAQKASSLKRCTACRMIVYCGVDCQKRDWPSHKAECKAIKKHDGIAGDSIRLVMRLAQKWKEEETDTCSGRRLSSLLSHFDQLEGKAEQFLEDLKTFAVGQLPVDDGIIKKLFAISSINSFSLTNESGRSIGVALCIALSEIDHSCRPTARIAYRGAECFMVPTGFGSATIVSAAKHSYIDELRPRDERRKELKDKYCFWCACAGCSDEGRTAGMEAWQCGQCDTGAVEPSDTGRCNSCGWCVSPDHSSMCRMAEEMALAGSRGLARDGVGNEVASKLAEQMLEVLTDALHPLNVRRLPALRRLYAIAVEEKDLEKAISHGRSILAIMSAWLASDDLSIAHHKYGLAQALKAAEKDAECRSLLAGVDALFGQVYGTDSYLYITTKIMQKD